MNLTTEQRLKGLEDAVARLTAENVALRQRIARTWDNTLSLARVLNDFKVAGGDLRVEHGLSVGSLATDPATGDVIATADARLGGGLSVGSTGTNPGTGDVIATADGRFGGGIYAGSVAVNPTTGQIIASASCSGWLPFAAYDTTQPVTATNAIPYAASIDRAGTLISIAVAVYVNGTNNGSNYWTINFKRWDTVAVLCSVNTSAISGSTISRVTWTGSVSLTTTMYSVYAQCAKAGSPGDIYIMSPAAYVQ